MRTVHLVIHNTFHEEDGGDAITHRMDISASAVNDVLAWYGTFYHGDPYTVTVNGQAVKLDQNGEREFDTIDLETA